MPLLNGISSNGSAAATSVQPASTHHHHHHQQFMAQAPQHQVVQGYPTSSMANTSSPRASGGQSYDSTSPSSPKPPIGAPSSRSINYGGERFDEARSSPNQIPNGYAAAEGPISPSKQQPSNVKSAIPISASALLNLSQQSPSRAVSAQSAMPTTAASLMREGPRDFTVIKEVGDGSFGTVCLADWKSPLPSGTMLSPMQHPTTRPEYVGKRLVAIKKMKKPFPNWEECMKLKELKSLLGIPHHPNIIPLYDAFLMPTTKELHFVFECMEGNLYQLTKSRKGRPLAGGLVASIFTQIIEGLDHIHSHGYFHRDMKPENLLITTTGLADYPPSSPFALPCTPPEKDVLVIVKLADFGLARETDSKPPYTEYVSTRWYRAPEVLLRSRDYSNPVDMWALGTILAELVNLKPLFPGQSEVDQVLQICDVLGDPSPNYGKDEKGRLRGGGEWERGLKMARSVGFQFPKVDPINFASLFNQRVPTNLVECIQDLLRYDPKARLTTKDCLSHPYTLRDAPRLRPPQAKPAVGPTTASAARRPAPAGMVPDFASRRAIPPSHSNPLIPQSNKLPFGAAEGSETRNLAPMRQVSNGTGDKQPVPLHRVPFYAQPSLAAKAAGEGTASPMQEDTNEVQWAAAPGPSARDSGVSNYPAFPDSASLYSGSHNSMNFGDYARSANDSRIRPDGQSDAQSTDVTLAPSSVSHGVPLQPHQYRQFSQQTSSRTVYEDELSATYETDRQGRYEQPGKVGRPVNESTGELTKNDSNASTETINSKEKEKRRSKAWGINIASVFTGNHVHTVGNNGSGAHLSSLKRSPSGSTGGGSASEVQAHHSVQYQTNPNQTPAQQIAAEHQASSAAKQPPMDPKKAKKEAEKAAREAEKAKREAQQKLARDRARAVMQKRNQLLASSNNKDQVEWLSGAVASDDRVGQSEKARGKQPVQQISPSMANFPNDFARSPHHPSQQQPMSPNFGSHLTSPSLAPSMGWRGIGASRLGRSKARRREFDDDHSMSSFEDQDPRRISMQSYQTGDSDPGPATTAQYQGQPHYIHRANSSSSLASAPSMKDPRRFAASMESQRSSQDARSISSLDHQLITNMENMTAAEARSRTPGNVSPGPVHLFGSRSSVSRQSRGNSRASSASAHRQGSASPLHHASGIPRFHPYSHGTAGTSPSYAYQLPPLHQSLQQGDREAHQHQRGSSSGAHGSSEGGSHLSSLTHYQSQHHVNPIFHVPSPPAPVSANAKQQTFTGMTLPPFSQLAAAADDSFVQATSPAIHAQNTFLSQQGQGQGH